MTGSNRRPTPCKGAALPTELITPPETKNSIQGIFQCFARTELWNLGSLDFNRIACSWISACARCTFTDRKCTKTYQGHRPAFFQRSFYCANGGLQSARSGSFGNIGMFCNVFYQFGFIHKDPLYGSRVNRIVSSNIIFTGHSFRFSALRANGPGAGLDQFCRSHRCCIPLKPRCNSMSIRHAALLRCGRRF